MRHGLIVMSLLTSADPVTCSWLTDLATVAGLVEVVAARFLARAGSNDWNKT